MAMVDGGELVVRMLEREGVKQVYALQGGHIDTIMQACLDHGIKIYDTRHEQAAGHMADAYARLTGRPGVVVVTAGPGVTDVVTAVANAHMDAVPMVVLGGRYPLAEEEMMPLQELQGVALMQSITKWVRLVREPKRIPEYIAMAFREATTGRPGPVFLELPVDVLTAEVDDSVVAIPQTRPQQAPAPSPEAVEMALALLAQAKRPLIMAGRGVWLAGAAAELRQFAELTQVPVIANGMSRGALPEDEHPLSFGSFVTAGTTFLPAAGGPDVVLLLGGRFGLFTGGTSSFIPAQATIIQVDVAAQEIGRFRDVQLGIVADCREALRAFVTAAQGRTFEPQREWLDALSRGQAAFRSGFQQIAMTSSEECIHPYRLAYEVNRYLGGDAIIVADGGEMAIWMELAVTPKRPGSYLFHGYLGCLGTGIPFGLAAKAAFPDRRVAVITGDGSVGLNFAEFDTAVRHGLPIVVVIGNDQAWGMCRHEQMVRYGAERIVATELGPTRYEKAAEGFGVHAEFVERASDIVPALERAFASGRPACINVMTDPGVISPMVLASTSPAVRPRPVPQG
jgi:acetolactate synthase-1/2/3 large subunit